MPMLPLKLLPPLLPLPPLLLLSLYRSVEPWLLRLPSYPDLLSTHEAKTTDLERKSLELHGRLIHHSKMPLAMAPGRSVRPKSSGAGFALRNAWRPARSPEQFLLRVGLPVCGRRCSLLLRHSGDGLRRLRDEARIGGS